MSSLYAEAWQTIFEEMPILDSVRDFGFFDISADEIKRITKREPRLLTKIDFQKSLPKVMEREGLSILAIENGQYRIAKTNPFISILPSETKEIRIQAPTGFVTIDPFDITSESMALDIAKVSGMLDKVFEEETELTIRGRLRKGAKFDFELDDVNYPVNGVQIEVDGGYEGRKTVNLIEAKLGDIRSLNIRQLLYPELAWKGLIGEKRDVRSYAFIYEKSIFRFLPFVKKAGIYCLDHEAELSFKFMDPKDYDIMGIKLSTSPDLNFEAPFPQADDFDKVIIMLKKLHAAGGEATNEELSLLMEENDIGDIRQVGYYSNCLRLFKLADKIPGTNYLTGKGFELATESNKTIAFEIAKSLFSERVFHTALHRGASSVTDEMLECGWKEMSGTTIKRRKGTLSSWVNWYRTVFDLV